MDEKEEEPWHWYDWFWPWSSQRQVQPASTSSTGVQAPSLPTSQTTIPLGHHVSAPIYALKTKSVSKSESRLINLASKSTPLSIDKKKELTVGQHALLRTRKAASMTHFPVDDDEVYLEPLDSNTTSSWVKEVKADRKEHSKQPVKKVLLTENSSQDQLQPSIDIEDDIFQETDESRRDPLYAPYGFIIMCCFQVAWGLVGTIQVVVIRLLKQDSMEFLLLDKHFSQRSSHYLLAATLLTILGGILGILAILQELPILLYAIPHLMWMIITMCLAGSMTAAGGWSEPTTSTYYRLFESIALYPTYPNYLEQSWPGVSHLIWDRMQKTLKCCGVTNSNDWVKIPKPSIPTSCCYEDVPLCTRTIANWTAGQKTSADFENNFYQIKPLLYADNCIHVLSAERTNHIRDWTVYPIIYLAFQLLMMVNLNYLANLIQNEYRSWEGISRLQMFKAQGSDVFKSRLQVVFWSFIPFCCKKKKKDVTKHHERISHTQVSNSPADSTATKILIQEVKESLMKTAIPAGRGEKIIKLKAQHEINSLKVNPDDESDPVDLYRKRSKEKALEKKVSYKGKKTDFRTVRSSVPNIIEAKDQDMKIVQEDNEVEGGRYRDQKQSQQQDVMNKGHSISHWFWKKRQQ